MSNEASQRYIPTRLEWCILHLNAMFGISPPVSWMPHPNPPAPNSCSSAPNWAPSRTSLMN